MDPRDQPTPPFNSPYQHAPKPISYLHTPAYPSPARSDTEPSRYPAQGLGLYQYNQPFTGAPGPILFPPSPQPTEAWSGASPMTSAPVVDPWASGAYDHPVSRSPIPWPHYQPSHRSSLPSHRHMPAFSSEEAERGFSRVKVEADSGWHSDEDMGEPSGTIAPERLSTSSMLPYDSSYESPMSHYDSTPGPSFDGQFHGQDPYGGRPRSSQSDSKAGLGTRTRRRRTNTPGESARFFCKDCGRGFIRSYNMKTHMQRHDPNHSKDHLCEWERCDKAFERKTDLERHVDSVHRKKKSYHCDKCDKSFARKDTLTRHQTPGKDNGGGCPKSNQVDMTMFLARSRSMQRTVPDTQAFYPSPRAEPYGGFQEAPAAALHGGFDSRVGLF